MMAQVGEADFVSGNVESVDYTPSSAVAIGEVVVVGVVPYVAHAAIAANELGALAAHGGVYECVSDGSLDTGGALAYWDASEGEIVASATGNTHFGYTVPNSAAVADQGLVRVFHSPNRAGA